jgi:hypothetical protein
MTETGGVFVSCKSSPKLTINLRPTTLMLSADLPILDTLAVLHSNKRHATLSHRGIIVVLVQQSQAFAMCSVSTVPMQFLHLGSSFCPMGIPVSARRGIRRQILLISPTPLDSG